MEFAVPDSLDRLGFILLAVGVTLLAASYRIGRLARSYRRRMESLLHLASQPIDPLELPAAAWPELAGGGWQRLDWEGNWFGQPVAGMLGAETLGKRAAAAPPLTFELASGDEARLRLALTHTDAWGEHRLFAEHLARVFVLLLETRLHARTEALSAALAERARLSLYLQHDMRNLAQWVLWVSEDFAACGTPETLLAAARRLRDNAPLARDRAELACRIDLGLDTPIRGLFDVGSKPLHPLMLDFVDRGRAQLHHVRRRLRRAAVAHHR